MFKLQLSEADYIIEAFCPKGKETFHIAKGMYEDKRYEAVIITAGLIILDGEESLQLSENVSAVYINMKRRTILDQIAEFLKNDDVYMEKVDAVPKDKERELLRFLIGDKSPL
jgi:intein/homing endonuclease